MKRILHIVLVLVVAAACQGPRVIPKDTLTDIYTDMFLADQQVRELNIPHSQMDTMLLYEAVFEKYGYDTDDYLYSVQHYLKDPERFAKVFDAVAARLEGEVNALQKIIEREDEEARRLARRYPQVDSIIAPFAKESCYAGLARMERDTALYAALYRLVAIQEDTLMVPVDSVEARARRETQNGEFPTNAASLEVEKKPVMERPAKVSPKVHGNIRPVEIRTTIEFLTKEKAMEEEVEEERAE